MDCPLQRGHGELLLDYCAGRLPVEDRRLLTRHMEACPDCARFVAAQHDLWMRLDEWEPAPVSLDFNRRLYSAIERERLDGPIRRGFRTIQALWTPVDWRPALPALAACLTLVIAAWMGASDRSASNTVAVHTPPSSQVRVENVDLEQVEQALEDIDLLGKLDPQSPVNRSSVSTM